MLTRNIFQFNHVPEPEMLHVSATPGRLGKLIDV
jgi:hypothetical protein